MAVSSVSLIWNVIGIWFVDIRLVRIRRVLHLIASMTSSAIIMKVVIDMEEKDDICK